MLSLDWRITLVVVILTPLSLFAAKFIATRTYDMFRMQSKTLGEQTALVGEMLDGERVVQAFSREERAVDCLLYTSTIGALRREREGYEAVAGKIGGEALHVVRRGASGAPVAAG